MTKKLSPELEKYVDNLRSWVKGRKKDLQYSIEQFDKLIIALSSGGLALSMGFVKDIVKITNETNTLLLKDSWYSFALSLIIILLSQFTTYQANKIEINISEDEINQYEQNHTYDESISKRHNRKEKFYNNLTIFFNLVSFLTLILGIILFIVFVNQNI